jgi:hypothetical protein
MLRKARVSPAYRERRRNKPEQLRTPAELAQHWAQWSQRQLPEPEPEIELPPLRMPMWLARALWALFGWADRCVGTLEGVLSGRWRAAYWEAALDHVFRIELYASSARFHRASDLWFLRLARLVRAATPPETGKPRREPPEPDGSGRP